MLTPPVDIDAAINEAMPTEEPRQHYTHWSSEVGHPCERFLYHARVDWPARRLPDVHLLKIFEQGRDIEERVRFRLAKCKERFEIPDTGFPLTTLEEYQISGKLDVRIRQNGLVYPGEIKSIQDHAWKRLPSSGSEEVFPNSVVLDALSGGYWRYRMYPAQLQLYIFGEALAKRVSPERALGFFIFVSKATTEEKTIWTELDYEYVEGLLQKAERVNTAIARHTPPDRMPFDLKVCGQCDFQHICLPDVDFGQGAKVLPDEQKYQICRRAWELGLKDILSRDEFAEEASLHKTIKEIGHGEELLIVEGEDGHAEIRGHAVKNGWKHDSFDVFAREGVAA